MTEVDYKLRVDDIYMSLLSNDKITDDYNTIKAQKSVIAEYMDECKQYIDSRLHTSKPGFLMGLLCDNVKELEVNRDILGDRDKLKIYVNIYVIRAYMRLFKVYP